MESPNDAVTELYNQYNTGLVSYVGAILKDRERAEELVQEVWIQVLKSLPTLPTLKAPGWLYTIARNKAIDELRRRGRIGWVSLDALPIGKEPEYVEGTHLWTSGLLEGLTPEQATVMVLRYEYKYTLEESAKILQLSLRKVKALVAGAMATIKQELQENGTQAYSDHRR